MSSLKQQIEEATKAVHVAKYVLHDKECILKALMQSCSHKDEEGKSTWEETIKNSFMYNFYKCSICGQTEMT